MRPDDDADGGDVFECEQRLLGNPELRRSAPPEQITGCGGDDDPVWCECRHPLGHVPRGQVVKVRVDEQDVVPRPLEQGPGVTVFERQVRLAAAEVDAAVERPSRVDERELHGATRPPTTSRAPAVSCCINHASSRPTPFLTDVFGRQPVTCSNFAVSET